MVIAKKTLISYVTKKKSSVTKDMSLSLLVINLNIISLMYWIIKNILLHSEQLSKNAISIISINSLGKLFNRNKKQAVTDNSNKSGVYKLSCNDCTKYYIEQTLI